MQGKLTPTHLDAMTELFNIGIGRAASRMSGVIESPFDLSIPRLELQSVFELRRRMLVAQTSGEILSQQFLGDCGGDAYLIINRTSSLELIRILLGDGFGTLGMGDIEREALKEITNQLLNACLGTLAEVLEFEQQGCLPRLVHSKELEERFRQSNVQVLLVSMVFATDRGRVEGQVAYVMSAVSMERLVGKLNQFLRKYA